jgi:hypothetical protein
MNTIGNKNFNKKNSVISVLIAFSFLLGGLTILIAPPVEAMSDGHFDMFTSESTRYVANEPDLVSRRTATFDIQIKNFDSEEDIIEFDYEWNYLGGDPENWIATFSINPLLVGGLDGNGPGRAATTISITAPPNSDWEDLVVPLILTGTSTVVTPPPDSQRKNTIWLTTIMNSYEANITHDNIFGTQIFFGDPYQFAVPVEPIEDVWVDFLMRVINLGKVETSIDLIPHYVPAGWTVEFWTSKLEGSEPVPDELLINTNGDPEGYDDTDSITWEGDPDPTKNNYLNIIMRVKPDAASLKYQQEEIEIESNPFGDVISIRENNGFVDITTTVMHLINTISDEEPLSPHFYYKDEFRGHNVNPGLSTTYDISIFTMDDTQGDVTLDLVGNSLWNPTLFDAAGEELETNTIPSAATVGDFVRIYLKVTAPVDAAKGAEELFTVSADVPGGPSPDESIKMKAKVTLDKKVYILNLDSINQDYLYLDNTGREYDPSEPLEIPLMPNVWDVIRTGSMYKGVTNNLPAVTDNNHVGIIASWRILYGME